MGDQKWVLSKARGLGTTEFLNAIKQDVFEFCRRQGYAGVVIFSGNRDEVLNMAALMGCKVHGDIETRDWLALSRWDDGD